MRDIQTPLRELLVALFDANAIISYEAGAIPENAATPYIIISNISSQENSNKTGFGNSVQTLLDIVTKYSKDILGGSKEVDTIAGIVLSLINSKIKFPIFAGGLQIVNTKILQDQKLNQTTDNSRIYRRLIRIEQLIMEV